MKTKVRVIFISCIVLTLGISVPAFADDITSGDYQYKKNNDDSITITKFNGEESIDLIIPDNLDGFTVKEIGKGAFSYKEFNSLSIPDSVETLDDEAFRNTDIKNDLIIPAGIVINKKAFYGADLPETLEIPEDVQINNEAFSYGQGIAKLYLGDNVVVGKEAFRNSGDLEELYLGNNISMQDKAFYSCNDLEIIAPTGDVYIDEFNTIIEKEVFGYCGNFTTIIIPDDTKFLGDESFRNNDISETLSFPPGITIGKKAFYSTELPETLVIYSGTTVEDETFAYSDGLKYLYIKDDCKVDDEAFRNNDDLEIVVIGSNVELGKKCFYSCNNLKTVYINSASVIKDEAFSYSKNLETAYLAEDVIIDTDKSFKGTDVVITDYIDPSSNEIDATANKGDTETYQESEVITNQVEETETTTVTGDNNWICPVCEESSYGNFCSNCGTPKPNENEFSDILMDSDDEEVPEETSDFNVEISIDSLINIIFSKYDIEIYLDDDYIDTIKNSESTTFNAALPEGIHTIHVNSADNDEVTGDYTFSVSGDGSFSCRISSYHDKITFGKLKFDGDVQKAEVEETVEETETQETKTETETDTEEDTSIVESEIETEIVAEQVTEPESVSIAEPASDAVNEVETTIDSTVNETTTEPQKPENFNLENELAKITAEALSNINFDTLIPTEQITDLTSSELVYNVQSVLNAKGFNCGTPDGSAGPNTQNAIRNFETAYGMDSTGVISSSLLNSLGLEFDKEYAQRAVITAMINQYADDVFMYDGSTRDASKFHSYDDLDQANFFVKVYNKGKCERIDDTVWKCSDIKLTFPEYDTTAEVTAHVIYDGNNYLVFGLKGSAPSYEDISLFQQETDYGTVFVVPSILVSRGRAVEKTEEVETTKQTSQEQVPVNTASQEQATTVKSSHPANYHSSDDADIAKQGNSGVYAYKSRGGQYENYIIIDFDARCVYSFSEGNSDDTLMVAQLTSGDLNSVVIVTYNDSGDVWQEGLRFNWVNQPDHLILQDSFGWDYDFYTTDLASALRLKNSKSIVMNLY